MKYLLFIPLFIFIWIIFDVVRALIRKKVPDLPEPDDETYGEEILARLGKGEEIPENELAARLESTYDYINKRFDCADFKLTTLIRIYLQFGDILPQQTRDKIKNTILNFKYWMDEPGKDSMCFWSENHQMLFSGAEYLAGQTFPDEIFINDGKRGKEHMEKAFSVANIDPNRRGETLTIEEFATLSNIIFLN